MINYINDLIKHFAVLLRCLLVFFLFLYINNSLEALDTTEKNSINPDFNLEVANGESKKNIVVKWNNQKKKDRYLIYRSSFETGPYEEIGTTDNNIFSDSDAVPGIKYWYRVSKLINGIPSLLSVAKSGYRMIPMIKSENLDKVIRAKKKRRPRIKNKEMRKKEALYLDFLQKYYTNNVKLSVIMFIGKRYIKRGNLILLRDFDDFKLDHKNRTVYLIKKGKYVVKFFSKKFFRILRESKTLAPKTDELSKRLLINILAFCIYNGIKEQVMENGVSNFVHSFEAAGVATEYFKDNKNWQFNTIMLGSSNKKIKNMIKKVQKRD